MNMTEKPLSHCPEAMIFDLDGTLFQTETLLLPAYHAMFEQLRNEGLFDGDTPPESHILGALGMLLDDIFLRVMPESTRAAKHRANELLLHYQLVGLRDKQGLLYTGVADTLTALHARGIRLFVASNGLKEYVEQVIHVHGLSHVFEGLFSAGGYQTKSKVDLVRILLDHHRVSTAWMIGDRSSDVEAGLANELPVVGCAYAEFGNPDELLGSTYIIHNFEQLLDILDGTDEQEN